MKIVKTTARILVIAFLCIIIFGPSSHTQAAQMEVAQTDIYEPNDSCKQATTIQPDGTIQSHNFHTAGDTDWVQFTAPTNGTYRIEVDSPVDSLADVDLELYSACNVLPSDSWTEALTPGVQIDVTASANETFYMQLNNSDSNIAGSDVTYGLSVQYLSQIEASGAVIIVAGRKNSNDQSQRFIHNTAQSMYNLFQKKGETDDNIYFLATDSTLEGYDTQATVSNLEYAITQWAVDRVSENQALTIYFVNVSPSSRFYIDGVNGEILTLTQLDEWLTTLELAVPNVKSNIIIEACDAGLFIESPDSISKANRVIIASASEYQYAYVTEDSAAFSDEFVNELARNINLAESFLSAKNIVKQDYQYQDSQIDADGDGVPNEPEDLAIASERGFHVPGSFGGGTVQHSTSTPQPPTSTPTPIDIPTEIPTPTQVSTSSNDEETYEPNNDCATAHEVVIDGIPQSHTFHQVNDQDWTAFTASTAGTYRIEVNIPDGSKADVDLYYYTDCEAGFHTDRFTAPFSPAVRLDVKADNPGQRFYIKSKNYDPSVAGPQVAYNLSVRQLTDEGTTITPGPAIVVAGRYRIGDELQVNIDQTALAAYELLATTGRYDSDILFLATDSSLPNFDGEATQRNLEYGITTWAKERLEKENVSQVLTLYLVDHGGPDEFYLDRSNEEILTSNDLHTWLTELEDTFPHLLVNVVIEACKAGSFIDPIDGSISKPGRLIITSSNKDYDAYASLYGARFSDNFISFLSQEKNLGYSFQESRNIVQKFYSQQQPWLDSDGNGIPNESNDIAQASRRSIANWSLGPGLPPYIAQVMADQANGGVRLQAEVRHEYDNPYIKAVWGVVYPPDYVHPTGDADYTEEGQLNGPELERLEFIADTSTNALFVSAEDFQFTQPGRYQVAIHAQDIDGLEARPVIVEVEISPTPTPTPTVTATPTSTATPLPTSTDMPLPTATPVPTVTHTPTPTVTPIPTATPDDFGGTSSSDHAIHLPIIMR